jgi:hypothetical protein
VSAQVIAHDADVDAVFATVAVAVPVLAFEVMLFVLQTILAGRARARSAWSLAGAGIVLAAAVVAAAAGVTLGGALVVVALSPAVIVVGHEAFGRRHEGAMAG